MIRKYLDASTAHLPESVFRALVSTDGVIYTEHNYGCWIWVPEDVVQRAAVYSWPPELIALVSYARDNGCDWINLDADADEIPTLKVWDW